jgi:hypothetical protein
MSIEVTFDTIPGRGYFVWLNDTSHCLMMCFTYQQWLSIIEQVGLQAEEKMGQERTHET